MKYQRHSRIIQIISENAIETQDQLIEKLAEFGMEVTQATISRDIRELKLIKVSTENGGYRYAMTPKEDVSSASKYRTILLQSVVRAEAACNLVVVKTFPGMAQACAAAVDGMAWSEIVGTLAGDDTIVLIMRSEEQAIAFAKKFQNLGDED